MTAIRRFAEFVTAAEIPAIARAAARDAFQDAIGVMLAGATEPAARLVQRVTRTESADGPSSILATPQRAGASWAALANGTAAHALDFDDMCWVTLAHPSTRSWQPRSPPGKSPARLAGVCSRGMSPASRWRPSSASR